MNLLVALALLWAGMCFAFLAGALWATRRAEPRPPVPQFRRVARPCMVAPVGLEYIAIAADYVAKREDFSPADQRVLDELVETQ